MGKKRRLSGTAKVRRLMELHVIGSVKDEWGKKNEREFTTVNSAAAYIAREFKRVADYPYNLHKIPNTQDRFKDYLMGIPFNFEWENYKIEEFLNGLGINPDGNEYSVDQMWDKYSYLIWKVIRPEYNSL